MGKSSRSQGARPWSSTPGHPTASSVVVRTVGRAVHTVSVHGDRTPRLLVDTPYTEDELDISPNGRWVAFNSDESGRFEVNVASFPDFTSKQQVAGRGGVQPQWRADGRELFYLAPDSTLMSVGVEPARRRIIGRGERARVASPQCVASGGVVCKVASTTIAIPSGVSAGRRPGRGASFGREAPAKRRLPVQKNVDPLPLALPGSHRHQEGRRA